MFEKFTRKIIKGLARAETPYVYLRKDQHLCYSYNDIFKREMIFSEPTPYKVLRQQSHREMDRIHYRLFATDALHEHYLNLEGSIEIPKISEREGTSQISMDEEIINEGDHIVSNHREMEAGDFSDKVEFSTLHMNKKYPSLTVRLFNLGPEGSIKVRKTTDKSRRGKREVTWEYDIILKGKKYSGHDHFIYSHNNYASIGTINSENIPMLEGDTKEHADFSNNSNALGKLSIDLKMAPMCSPYLNITKEYEKNGSTHLCSYIESYLEDYKITSEVAAEKINCKGSSDSSKPIRGISVRSGKRILCLSSMTLNLEEDVTVIELKDVKEKNGGPTIEPIFHPEEYLSWNLLPFPVAGHNPIMT